MKVSEKALGTVAAAFVAPFAITYFTSCSGMRQKEENLGHPDAFQGYSLQNQKTSYRGPTLNSSTRLIQEAGPKLFSAKVYEILKSPTMEKGKDNECEIILSNAQAMKIEVVDC